MIYATGIGRHLVGHLSFLTSKGFSIIAGVRDENGARALLKVVPGAEILSFKSDIYSLNEHWRGSFLARSLRSRVSAFWFPHYNVPWYSPSPSVVTVHDLIHFKQPMFGIGKVRAEAAKKVMQRAVLQASRIVCVSNNTATDLKNFEPRIVEKIRVIPNSVSSKWHPLPPDERERFQNSRTFGKYILLVGNKKLHKNQALALRIIDHLVSLGLETRLVVIGRHEASWRREVDNWRLRGGAYDRLLDLENVTDQELETFYASAEMLLMPSLYEGFGLPPLEAMASGTPVVCSSGGALPETVGTAAIVLNPLDVGGWIEAVLAILGNRVLREDLIGRGFKRAELFSEQESGYKLSCVFDEVIDDTYAA